MLIEPSVLVKLQRMESRYEAERFETLAEPAVEYAQTKEHFRTPPTARQGLRFRPATPGMMWGGEWVTAWFRGRVRLPGGVGGRRVCLRARLGSRPGHYAGIPTSTEALLFVGGRPRGVFDENHFEVVLVDRPRPGQTVSFAVEAYGGHPFWGSQPDEDPIVPHPKRRYDGITLVAEREDVSAFVFDLRVLRQLVGVLPGDSLRRAEVAQALAAVWEVVPARPDEVDEAQWRPALAEARRIMAPLLARRNGPTAPKLALVGHSHLDTAWLWPVAETWRKCARTFSSMLTQMRRFPEATFIQSSTAHLEAVEREYPVLFEEVRKRVREGRWEPNGGMYIEPDCNLPSGEALVRQFLIGQQQTQAWFGYRADTMWQPDVFGYSAALPQILRGCGIEFFCTTKLDWNETNRFPLDTFHWQGIDGTKIIAHFHNVQGPPDPATLDEQWKRVQHPDAQDRRLFCYGWGDGGGGPTPEMLEIARRVEDLEGLPRAEHTTVSRFMRSVRDDLADRLPTWAGELYLELHRGTLTSIGAIKRHNRKAEFGLRDAEFLGVAAALGGRAYPAERLRSAWKTLLLNQFHDILPGTSIPRVNDEALAQLGALRAELDAVCEELVPAVGPVGGGRTRVAGAAPNRGGNAVRVLNSLSWTRRGELTLSGVPAGRAIGGQGVVSQAVRGPSGERELVVSGVELPPLSVTPLPLVRRRGGGDSAFRVTAATVRTPWGRARLDKAGRIRSLVHNASGREVVAPGGSLNRLLLGEDVPKSWDTWDIDHEQRRKMRPEERLVSREVVADGPLQLRIRHTYKLGDASELVQDVVFHAGMPMVSFDTVIDWREKHKLLKAAFDLNVLAEHARHEVQFGHVLRPTHTNLPTDRSRFEVCNHKWTDLSDNGFGVAVLNDCKYGVSVRDQTVGLSLIKGGMRPDPRGDAGRHVMRYAVLVHDGPFGVESVVRPGYEFNVSPRVLAGGGDFVLPVRLPEGTTLVASSVKWAESGRALVVRLYEAGGASGRAELEIQPPVRGVSRTNLLEEQAEAMRVRGRRVTLAYRPFEVITLRCDVGGRS